MGGKSGKHNPDDVLIGYMDSPEIKAMTTYVAEAEGFGNVADMFRSYIMGRAIAHGIVKDGKASPEWADRIKTQAAAIRQKKRERSEKKMLKKGSSK